MSGVCLIICQSCQPYCLQANAYETAYHRAALQGLASTVGGRALRAQSLDWAALIGRGGGSTQFLFFVQGVEILRSAGIVQLSRTVPEEGSLQGVRQW